METCPAKPDDVVVVGDDELRRIDGVWYWILFADVHAPTIVDAVVINQLDVDIFAGKEIGYPGYRAGKRQVNKRDLRRYGLRNTAAWRSGACE